MPLLIPLVFFLPGYLFSRFLFRSPGALSAGECWFLPLALGACIAAWLSLTLAELGVFSLLNVVVILVAVCAVLLLFAWLRRPPSPRATDDPATGVRARWSLLPFRPDWIFLGIIALAFFLYARPAEYFIGNSDAGTYVNTGAHIARSGALAKYDAQVAQLSPEVATSFFWSLPNPYMLFKQARLPGFFIADPAQGLVLPQFLHLYPAWLALWDSLLGLQWGLFATPLIALLGSVAFYFLVRELFGQNLARLALFLLVVNVPQFWFARYPVAEAMTQFLMLTGMYALVKMSRASSASRKEHPSTILVPDEKEESAKEKNRVGLGLVAGIAFGELFLVRSDSLLFLVPLTVYALVLIFFRSWRREHWALFGALAVLFVQAAIHTALFAPTYFYFQFTHALRMQNIDKLLRLELPAAEALFSRSEYLLGLVVVVVVGAAALFVADRLFQRVRGRWGTRGRGGAALWQRSARVVGAGLVVAFVALFYVVLPRPETLLAYIGGITPTDTPANLVKLGWYLSPLGIGLATLGAVVIILLDLNTRNAFFFGTAAFFSLFYLEELYSNPHAIYTLRHYVPLVIPLFLLLAARALHWLWQGGPKDLVPPKNQALQRGISRTLAVGAFGLWMLYNLYVMGIIDPCGAQRCAPANTAVPGAIASPGASGLPAATALPNTPVVRVPFLANSIHLGIVQLEPFEKSITGSSELGGALSQLETLANALDPNAVVVMSGNKRDEPALLAAPLTFVFGRDALVTVADQPDGETIANQIDAWRAQGREVMLAFGTNGGRLSVPRYTLEPVGSFGLDVPQWAFAYDVMPRAAWRLNVNYGFFRAVPRVTPERYPFVLNFGANDFPYLVSGFLERPPEAQSRWMGGILVDNAELGRAGWLNALVRIPVSDKPAHDLKLYLRARAPRDGVQLEIRNNSRVLGSVSLSQDNRDYALALTASQLEIGADGYVLELVSQATPDGEGRILGAELESMTIEAGGR